MYLLWQYSKQRSPLSVLSVIAFCLFISGLNESYIDQVYFFTGWISVTLYMFLIRLWDDIADLPIDRITHPSRLLVQSSNQIKGLLLISLVLAAILCLLQVHKPKLALTVLLAIAFLILFFTIKTKLPTVLNVVLLNCSMFFPTVYAAYLSTESVTNGHILIGVFICLGGIAHDFSHSVMDVTNRDPKTLNPINLLNQKRMAWSALWLFLSATALGIYLYQIGATNIAFISILAIATMAILFFQYRLIRSPNERNAKPFYYLGFIFFLAPVLANYVALSAN